MADTARTVIEKAMSKIDIFPDEGSIPASETTFMLAALNDLMADWEEKGIFLGYSQLSSITDTLTVPRAAIRGIVAALAIEVHQDFLGAPPSSHLMNHYEDAMATIYRLASSVLPMTYPNQLPVGGGNDRNTRFAQQYFADEEPRLFVTNSGATITISVADTAVVIGGTNWSTQESNMFDVTTAGKATCTADHIQIRLKATIYAEVASGTDDLTFYVAKNGVVFEDSAVQISSTAGTSQEINLSKRIDLFKDDYIELYCKNNDTTENITISTARMRLE